MKVAMLTGGGDCPGLNAVIRAVVQKGETAHGDELVGFLRGWRGAMEGTTVPLDIDAMQGTLPKGGTVLGSSRTNPFNEDGGAAQVVETAERLNIDALVAIGGEDTLGVASRLWSEYEFPVVGVPKTIDNDLDATEVTFGFDTAVQTATDAIDRLQTTSESHDRIIVCEVMGRHAGHIATWAGIAGGACLILIPEEDFDIEEVCALLQRRHDQGREAGIIVVAEGATPKTGSATTTTEELDAFGHVQLGGIGEWLAAEIDERTGFEPRVTVLGHIQRGGTPTAYDRVLSTRFGVEAIDAVHDGDFGHMVALRSGSIDRVPLTDATAELKTVDPEFFHGVAEVFFD